MWVGLEKTDSRKSAMGEGYTEDQNKARLKSRQMINKKNKGIDCGRCS
jgi:hypothetical protein